MEIPYPFVTRQGTVTLRFVHEDDLDDVEDPLRKDLSAAAAIGDCLFVASDEGATIERLVRTADGEYAEHTDVALGDFFDLPGGRNGEMDVEGLAVDGGFLWITGSHSLKRDDPDPDDPLDEQLADLDDIDSDPNRYFLGRVPLVETSPGVFEMKKKVKRDGAKLRSGRVKQGDDGSTVLVKHIRDDEHFGPFLDVPCKENGFDIEGLAVIGPHVFLGLRGPVIGGWAIVLELDMKTTGKRTIKPRKFPDGRRYRKHFLNLGGLGIRDLLVDGSDLLVLAGPTMDLDGPFPIFRWSDVLAIESDTVTGETSVERVLDLPFRPPHDHAEAMAFLPDGRLVVGHDDPHPDRLVGDSGLVADVFDLDDLSTDPISTRHAGGGWHDVTVHGRTVDRVEGSDAADARALAIRAFDGP